jgi:hypothetical protein
VNFFQDYGQSNFLGADVLADQEKNQELGSPEIEKIVSTLKLIQAIHRLKWTWQLGNVALAMWDLAKQT